MPIHSLLLHVILQFVYDRCDLQASANIHDYFRLFTVKRKINPSGNNIASHCSIELFPRNSWWPPERGPQVLKWSLFRPLWPFNDSSIHWNGNYCVKKDEKASHWDTYNPHEYRLSDLHGNSYANPRLKFHILAWCFHMGRLDNDSRHELERDSL